MSDMDISLDKIERSVDYTIETAVDLQDCTVLLFGTERSSASVDYPTWNEKQRDGEDGEQTVGPDDVQHDANICAIDADGQLCWTVTPQVSGNPDARYTEIGFGLDPPNADQVWVRHSDGRVNQDERYESSLWARHTDGYAYVLDKSDGSIVEKFSAAINTIHVNGSSHSFPYPIKKTAETTSYTFVLLETRLFMPIRNNRTELFYRNIVAFDDTGMRIWQIEGLPTNQISGGYTDIWVEGDTAYAKHDVYGSVRIDQSSGAVKEVTATTLQNVVLLDRETAVVCPKGLGNALDRGTHVVTLISPEDWADEASMYGPDDKLSDMTPPLHTVVELETLPGDTNVFSLDKFGGVQWSLDPVSTAGEDSRFNAVGTHFQVGDAVWAKHDNGRLYRVGEQDGSHLEACRQSVVQFSDLLVEFPYRVKTLLETDERVVVLLAVDSLLFSADAIPDQHGKPFADQNILGFDRSGNLRWIIDAVRPGSPYVNILKEDNTILFRNWDSCGGKVDPQTGEILESHFMK